MEELKMELKVLTSEVDKAAEDFGKLPASQNGSSEYHYLRGKLEAYNDVLNMVIWRINMLENKKGDK